MTAQPANAGEIARTLIEEVAIIRSLDPATLSPDTPLSEIGIDSLGLVEILVFIEKTYSLNLLESGLSRQHLRSISTISQGVWEKRFGSRS
jgi:acyl carrier protein